MPYRFRHHIIDADLPPGLYAQVALADFDNDGRPEYVTGQQYGTLFLYKYRAPDRWEPSRWEPSRWERRVLGEDSPSDVGACALDVDGDGWLDLVTGGAWYRNPGPAGGPFERCVFDPDLAAVHDVAAADIDGDGRPEVLTMSDRNSLRWYKVPADPRQPWPHHDIGRAVHAGLSVGDVDGDGDLDVVRTDVWFENVRGDATGWIEHPIGPNTPPPQDFQPYFAFDATYSVVCDMNRDGANDILFTDAEIPGGAIWWMENLDGAGRSWRRHEIFAPTPGEPRRGAYHSLQVADFDGDGDLDVFSCEMEDVGGDAPPRYYIWENVDGRGGEWREHVILDANLGGHAGLTGDVTGNGLPDFIAKPWRSRPGNALGGKMFVLFLENLGS